MVIRNLILALVLLPISMVCLAAPPPTDAHTKAPDNTLTASISRTDAQRGEYLRVTLRYQGSQLLKNIDLQSWRQIAAISYEEEYNEKNENGNLVQVSELRLYPRGTGRFILPALRLGTAQSQPISINISQAVVNNHAVKLNLKISTLSPWQREAVTVQVQVKSADFAAHIELDPIPHQDFLSRPLKTERHTLPDGSYRFDAGWVLYPIDPGNLTLDLPPVRYRLSGSDRRLFYFPLQELHTRALPNYLPPTLPVGKLNVRSQINTENNQWQIRVQTHGLLTYGVPQLDTQLATISKHDISDIKIKHTQQSAYSDYGDRSLYEIPLPDWLMPFGKDLTITLRYFNSKTGRLDEITHVLPRHWNMPTWAWWITIILSLILGTFIIRLLQPLAQAQINRIILRRQLRNATSVTQLRRIILQHGQYVTLSDWATINHARKPAIYQLNYYCFSASGQADIQQLKTELLRYA